MLSALDKGTEIVDSVNDKWERYVTKRVEKGKKKYQTQTTIYIRGCPTVS